MVLPDPSELLTTVEVATQFKIQPSTLEKWRCHKSQPLKFIKIGNAVRYRRRDVEEYLLQHTEKGVPV